MRGFDSQRRQIGADQIECPIASDAKAMHKGGLRRPRCELTPVIGDLRERSLALEAGVKGRRTIGGRPTAARGGGRRRVQISPRRAEHIAREALRRRLDQLIDEPGITKQAPSTFKYARRRATD